MDKNARRHSDEEKQKWAEAIDAYRPDPERAERRKRFYPELAERIDLARVSVLDMIDMDEGRIRLERMK